MLLLWFFSLPQLLYKRIGEFSACWSFGFLILIPAQLPQKEFEFLRKQQEEEEGEFLFQVLCG